MASLLSLPEELFESVEQAVIIVEASRGTSFLSYHFSFATCCVEQLELLDLNEEYDLSR